MAENLDHTKKEKNEVYSGMCFISPNEGWLSGGSVIIEGFSAKITGLIYHTVDGGDTWTIQKEEVGGIFISVQFVNPMEGWSIGYGTFYQAIIFRSIDGGATWVSEGNVSIEPSASYFADSNNGWIVGDGAILHTSDAGKTWVEQDSGIEDLFSYAVYSWIPIMAGL